MGMDERLDQRAWIPIPDHVTVLLGRLVYYAAWLDDVLGEAVVHGTPGLTTDARTTPGWADSGARLVEAVRAIPVEHSFVGHMADRLAKVNASRNQLIHGVWLWQDDHVVVMKRVLGRGERMTAHATYTYEQIETLIEEYQHLGELADRWVTLLMESNPASAELENVTAPECPTDRRPMRAVAENNVMVWKCPECGQIQIR